MSNTQHKPRPWCHLVTGLLDSLGTALCLFVGAMGAVIAYHHSDPVPGVWRHALVGAVAVVAAIVGDHAAQQLLAPVYRWSRRDDFASAQDPASRDPEALLARLLDGGNEDTAASRAHQLDRGGVWLTDARAWQAHRDGASMHLAQGARLIWRADASPYAGEEFAVAMSDSPLDVVVKTTGDLHRVLTEHIAHTEWREHVPA